MTLYHVQYRSEALGGEGEFGVFLPEGWRQAERLKLLYLLHGAFSEYRSSLLFSSIARLCDGRNMAIVAPSSHLGVYCDMEHGENGYSMVKEVLDTSARMFPVLPRSAESTFLLGISMGGYGAFRLAMEFPARFSAVAACSSPVDIVATMEMLEGGRHFGGAELFHTFGSAARCRGTGRDVISSARSHVERGDPLPRLLLCWGDQDHAKPEDLAAAEKLRQAGIPLTTRVGKGSHNFDMWDPLLPGIMDWMLEGQEGGETDGVH